MNDNHFVLENLVMFPLLDNHLYLSPRGRFPVIEYLWAKRIYSVPKKCYRWVTIFFIIRPYKNYPMAKLFIASSNADSAPRVNHPIGQWIMVTGSCVGIYPPIWPIGWIACDTDDNSLIVKPGPVILICITSPIRAQKKRVFQSRRWVRWAPAWLIRVISGTNPVVSNSLC